MQEYINIGPVPCNEDCQQLGDPHYSSKKATEECERFIELIRKTCGKEPGTARLAVKAFNHDFGTYKEVVCWYDDRDEVGMDYAFHCESHSPVNWQGAGGKLFLDRNAPVDEEASCV